jgi:hypothetical protein
MNSNKTIKHFKNMKYLVTIGLMMATILVSCDSKKTEETNEAQYSCPMHPEVIGKEGDECPKCGMKLTEPVKHEHSENSEMGDMKNESMAEMKDEAMPTMNHENMSSMKTDGSIFKLIDNYISLKNALVNDDAKKAGDAGKSMLSVLKTINVAAFNKEQAKLYTNLSEDISEHAEHIYENKSKIDHQREHFEMLSKDMLDLVKAFGASGKIYEDFCPMYNDNKGGMWLSETKDIKNPYFGLSMATCGSVKATY